MVYSNIKIMKKKTEIETLYLCTIQLDEKIGEPATSIVAEGQEVEPTESEVHVRHQRTESGRHVS